jgi:hypothetical protein
MESIPEIVEQEEYSRKEKILLVAAIVFLFFEIRYMWDWCQWFTNCPK